VLDVNVLVSGMLWGREPGRVLDAVRSGEIRLCLSELLLDQLTLVLTRPKFSPRLAAQGATAEVLVRSMRPWVEVAIPAPIAPPPGLRDFDDLAVLASAVAARADVIVTGDSHLLTLGAFQHIPIIDVREVLQRLGAANK